MLGNPILLKGKSWAGQGSALPLPLINNLRGLPYPVTIGGSNNVTFTLAASTSRQVPIFIGDEFVNLTWNLTYTWNNTSNAILHATTGAETTDTDSVLGVWYMYLRYVIATGAVSLIPSQGAPGYVQGPGHAASLGHLGTARDPAYFYQYVGFMVCTTAATPAFRAMVKSGYWYKFAPVSYVVITDAWTAPTAPTLAIPRLAKYGLEIGGTLETGAGGQIFIGSHTASTIWDAELDISEATASNVAEQVLQSPVTFSPNDTASPFYAIAAPAGDFHLTRIKDVV